MNASRGWWTEARVARLRQLDALGHSASEIAEALGTTKNAVIGKLWRLRQTLPFNPELFTEQMKVAGCPPRPLKNQPPRSLSSSSPKTTKPSND